MCIKKKNKKKTGCGISQTWQEHTQTSWHILKPADTDAITEAVTHFTTSKQDVA